MAGAIQGLTVVINGDATPLTRAMRQLKAEATTLRGHMTALDKLIKLDPTSTMLLTRQQQLLNAQMRQTATTLAALRTAYEQNAARAAEMTAAETRQFQNLQRRITETELQYAQLKAQAIEFGAAANASTLATGAQLTKVSQALSKVSTGFLVAGAGAAAFLALSVKSAYDFEQSFAGVRKTIIATDDEYKKLARSTRDIALTKPIDVNDVNEIMMYAGQLGIANEYLTKFASTMADLDVATDMDLEEGSMQLARFANIVGMSQGDVDRLGATIVDLGNNSATTESQIMLMAMRIAGTGSNLGMTASDVLALAATLSSLGIQAEMGGNAISTIMRRIDKDVALNTDTLETWAATAGMSADEFKTAWESDVTHTLLKVVGGMGNFVDQGNNLNVLLDDLNISYMRQVDVLQRLSRAEDVGNALVERGSVAWDQNVALVREASQRYDTAASKTKMMMNAFNELGITIGNEVLPSFKDVVLSITNAVQGFAKMDEGTKELVINMSSFAIASALVVKATQGITGGLGSLIKGYGSLKTKMAEAVAGEMAYMNMTIAENGAIDANTAAQLRNAEAKALQLRANAALIRDAAAKATANGYDTAATTMLARAEEMEAKAAAEEAFAHGLSSDAAIKDAQSKTMLGLAASGLKAKITALAAEMGVSAAAAAGITAGAVAAAAALALLVAAFVNTFEPTRQLTAAAREQKDALEEHERQYRELVAVEGEQSEAAIKARAALEEEREAFKNSAATVGEFSENMKQAREDQEQLSQSLHDTLVTSENQAGSMLNLVDSISALSEKSGKSAEDMTLMRAQVDALNKQMPELGLSIDEATGKISDQSGAWKQLVDEAARTKVAETALENYNKALAQQPTLMKNVEDATRQYNAEAAEYIDLLNAGTLSWNEIPASAQMAITALDDANKAMAENKNTITESLEAYRQYAERQAVLKKAVQDFATYTGKATSEEERAAEIAAKYTELLGQEVTAEDVLNAVLAERAKKEAEAAQATQEMIDSLNELNETNETFAQMLADSGMSIDELAQRLEAAGISADDFSKAIDDMADKVTDGFNRIEVDQEKTLEKFMENLAHNREVTERWGDNVRTLYERAGTDYQRDFVKKLVDYGPEAAQAIEDLVNSSDEDFDRFARDFRDTANSAVTVGANTTGVMSSQFAAMSRNIDSSMVDAANSTRNGSRNMANGLDSGTWAIRRSVDNIVGVLYGMDYEDSAWYWGHNIGTNLANGIWNSYRFVENAVASVASVIHSFLGHSVAEKGPLHNHGKGEIGWGQEMVANLVEGIESRRGMLESTMRSVASDISDPLSPATFAAQDYRASADWGAAAESGERGSVVNVTADITGNNFFIREEADVDKVAQAIADKVNREVDLA